FHRRLRATRLRVVELDARIVAAARAHFVLPANDARLAVEIGDGAAALAPECCDALIIDAFQDEQHVPQLASAEFYDGAFLALAEPGVMVVNFMDDRSEEHTSELQSLRHLVCRLLLEKKKKKVKVSCAILRECS